MISKVIIAEDIDSIGIGLVSQIQEHFNFQVHHAKYCDDAWLKIKRAQMDGEPFDLLISDMSFKEDHRNTNLHSGADLVARIRQDELPIKCIIYSIEDRPVKLRSFFKDLAINGYVTKGRNSARELLEAVEKISQGEDYIPKELQLQDDSSETMEIEDYDILLMAELSKGLSQEEIALQFKADGIKPSSLSSIEKRLNRLKIFLKAKNTIHLVAIAKDMGFI